MLVQCHEHNDTGTMIPARDIDTGILAPGYQPGNVFYQIPAHVEASEFVGMTAIVGIGVEVGFVDTKLTVLIEEIGAGFLCDDFCHSDIVRQNATLGRIGLSSSLIIVCVGGTENNNHCVRIGLL